MISTATLLADAPWLRRGALPRLLKVLDRDGEEARVVGGAVRNALLNEPVHEVDIATTARPDEVMRRVSAAGFKAVPTGIDHGTVTVIVESHPFEVTTLRQDVETFGRHANVVFGRDWKADAERRDFTINALSVSADGTVHDYVGGLDDLAVRRVRFIGDARQRIAEDYLRIMRFFRFHAAYGRNEPDRDAVHACIEGREGLALLSRERVHAETMKLLAAPGAVSSLAVMSETGLLLRVLGGVAHIASLAAMVRVENALGLDADPVRRLCALSVLVTEDAFRLRERLRLANVADGRLTSMADGWWRVTSKDLPAARRLLYCLGSERFTDRVTLAWARSGADADDDHWSGLATLPRRWEIPVFPLKADNLMRRGVARGPALGAALRAAEEAWIAQDFPREAKQIDAIAEAAVVATNMLE